MPMTTLATTAIDQMSRSDVRKSSITGMTHVYLLCVCVYLSPSHYWYDAYVFAMCVWINTYIMLYLYHQHMFYFISVW